MSWLQVTAKVTYITVPYDNTTDAVDQQQAYWAFTVQSQLG